LPLHYSFRTNKQQFMMFWSRYWPYSGKEIFHNLYTREFLAYIHIINKLLVCFVIKKQNPLVVYLDVYIVWSHGNYKVDTWIGFGSSSACPIQSIMFYCSGIIWWGGVFREEQFYHCLVKFYGGLGWLEITWCFRKKIWNKIVFFILYGCFLKCFLLGNASK